MKRTTNRRDYLKHLALALAIGVGMSAGSAQAQVIIEVGGNGVIGDQALTTGALPTTVGANWTVEGGAGFVYSGLVSPAATVTATGNVTLTFDHRYFIEAGWDGGAVFVSVNGGAFTHLAGTAFSANGYVGDTTANAPNAAWPGGEAVFYDKSAGYDTPALITSVADLGILTAGDTVAVEFRGGWDGAYNEPGTDWEVGAVNISDTSGAILNVDFTVDGASGFTVVNDGAVTAPWTYPKASNRFEIDADLLTADRYQPVAVGSVIDLADANIEVALLAGTLDIGDSFTLFDLSGGTTLAGSVGTLSLPPGTWDTSNLATTGTITILDTASPLIYEPFADLDTTLSGNTPGLGLTGTWNGSCHVGDGSLIYGRLAYDGGRVVTNPGNNWDNSGVNPGTTLSDAGLLDDGATLWFSCLIVKAAKVSGSNDRRIYVSLGTGNPDGFDRIGGNSGSGLCVAVNKTSNGVEARGWNNNSDGGGGAFSGGADTSVADGDTFLAVGKITWGAYDATKTTNPDVFELYLPDADLNLGLPVSTLNANFDQDGTVAAGNLFDTIGIAGGVPSNFAPEVDEIRYGATYTDVTPADVTAPVIVSTDPVDDSPSGNSAGQTATFNEPVFVGTGDIRIVNDTDTVTTTIPVGDPQIVVSGNALTITPTVPLLGGKAYHIEIDTGAVTNFNLVDFGGLSDPTAWNFIADGTPPTVDSITDNVSPLPLLTATSVTYTVTFDEPIIAATVDTLDFANGGSATITVDSVTPTANPAVYEVAVSAVTAGDLILEIVSGAVITDLSGNPLDTTSAIPDDTTITVNTPAVTAASTLVDFQATIASEQHPTYPNEGRYFHVSVNPANPGTGSYAATIVGTNTPAPRFVRNYTGPVEAYWFGGGANSVLNAGMTGGNVGILSFTTEDDTFDGFGQGQAKVWDATDPGALLATEGPGTGSSDLPYIASADKNSGLWRSLGGATGTIDISALASGSIHIYYGAFGAKPSVKVTMKDTDNVAADIVIADAHLNGDTANRSEFYLAEIDFVTDGFYDVIEFEWLSNGTDYTGNGRGFGVVVTGPDVVANPYASWAAGPFPSTLPLTDPSAALDFDAGGLQTGIEWAVGGDPTDPSDDAGLAPTLDTTTTPGSSLFVFRRADAANDDANTAIKVEYGSALTGWTEAVDGTAGVVITVDNDFYGAGIDKVTASLPDSLAVDSKLFARLNVVVTP